jgi:hypothetical protein
MTKLDPVIVIGDLILLDPEQRIQFYVQVCETMGLDARTRPLQYFEQIDRNGKRNLILYALRAASAQLRAKHGLSVKLSPAEFSSEAVIFTATVTGSNGQTDSAVGVESLKGFTGKEYADRIMAAQTKAKRRAILDFVGSGMLDESEVEGMKGSVVEVSDADLKDYVPIPEAPAPASAAAQATEVIAPSSFVECGSVIDPEIIKAANSLRDQFVSVTGTVPAPTKEENQVSMEQITIRLNGYRRDTLQRGGMRPSKGFGIAAKWEKFLRKHAPEKTIEQYLTLLTALDLLLKQTGETGVVAKIEQEIL